MSILRQTSEFGGMPTLKETQSLSAWGALVSAYAAWMFDAMNLQIFTLVLVPSVSDLVGLADPAEAAISTSRTRRLAAANRATARGLARGALITT
jgi:hypothetical protein